MYQFGAELRDQPVLGKSAKVGTDWFSLPNVGYSLQTVDVMNRYRFVGGELS
jgi:hypothetical protein